MNHYFSRVQLLDHPLDLALLAALSQHGPAYRDHVLMWRLFPGDGLPRDFVFRRDVDARGKDFYYLVSARPPQAEAGLFAVQSKPYAPLFEAGEWIRFDLRANPTVSRRGETDGKARRHDVLMEAKRRSAAVPSEMRLGAVQGASIRWLVEHAGLWGLDVREESVLANAYVQHKLCHKGRNIAFSSLDYQGLAQVRDPGLLVERLTQGVGHARAFGCGLLLAKRV